MRTFQPPSRGAQSARFARHRSIARPPAWNVRDGPRSKRLLPKPDNLIRYRQQASACSAAGSKFESALNAHALGSASQRIKLARLRPGSRRAPRATWRRVAFADQFGDAVPSHIREKVGIDAPEDNANTLARKLFKHLADGLRSGRSTLEIASASRTLVRHIRHSYRAKGRPRAECLVRRRPQRPGRSGCRAQRRVSRYPRI